MTLWLILALMTAAAIFAVLWPLARHRAAQPGGSEMAVYRDQLAEINRDSAAGLIAEPEASAARVEISRRLLSAADAANEHPQVASVGRRRAAALMALIALPAGAAALYLVLGTPDLPGAALSSRVAQSDAQRSIESLVQQVEAHLERNPQDGRGWEVVAPVYLRLGRFDDAVKARQNALRILGSTAEREAEAGEALTAAASGVVTADAKAAFERALALDTEQAKAQFYIGVAAEQDGKTAEAVRIWRALLARAPADAPWRDLVQQSLARIDPGTNAPGPNAEDVAAAEKLAPAQREEMVRGMVERLAERLKRDSADVEGWLRLVRAYATLGERDKARAAAGDARRAFGADMDKQRRLDDLVKGLGLEG